VVTFGVPLRTLPLMPEERGANHDQTHVLLCDPKNIFVGIWRKIRVESDRDISRGVIKIVVSMRFDVCVSEPNATVQAVAIGADGGDWSAANGDTEVRNDNHE
jgi:hypothetical protein